MIWESWPWKQELRRLSSTIDAEGTRVIDIEDEDDSKLFERKRSVFYAAFVVRKLIENGKITDNVVGHSIEVMAFRSLSAKKGNLSTAFTCPLSNALVTITV